jgi:uncharacterized protein (TIGR03435 family)
MIVRASACLSFVVFLASAAYGQATKPKATFDAADVRVSPRSAWVKKNNVKDLFQGGWLNGDRYQLRRATLLDLIKTAYSVDADRVYGGPNWLDYDRFEVVGKAPPGTRAENLRLMLQSLLADRFKLVVKTGTKSVPAYVLTTTKGRSKLKAADGSGTSGCTTRVQDGRSNVLECRNVTMDLFAAELRRFEEFRWNHLPVANQTGIDGTWDLTVQHAGFTMGMNADGTTTIRDLGMGVEEAVDKQLGLTLKLGTAPQPVLNVENASQPSVNPAAAAKALPPLPDPQFEVASLRLCQGERIARVVPRFEGGGSVRAQCYPLLSIIRQAWNLDFNEQIAGVPKWLSEVSTATNVTIAAKAPAGNFVGEQGRQDNDALNVMLRHLLLDRYKMKVHFEDRPMDALTLVAWRPKLVKANPSNRTGCTHQSVEMRGTPNVAHKVVCQNITLAQFAEQMQGFDPAIHYPVLDATGIQGAWDFTLNYVIRINWSAPAGALASGAAPKQAADPSGGLSLSEAINKQLGLKVVTRKRPEPVFMIDHMENKPAEN